MKAARKPARYDDIINAPEHMVAEIVDGELYTSRMVVVHSERRRHRRLA